MANDSEFVFRFQPAGPNDSTQACLVLAPDEAAALAITRKLVGDDLELTLCAPWELEQNPTLLPALRKRTPLGIGPDVENGMKLKSAPRSEWLPKLSSLD
jgi:hypothetical protein